jgi:integrase
VIQQGQVFKLKATCADGSRCGPTGIALRAAVRRGCRWAGSAAGLRRRGRFGTGWLARLLPDRRAAALTLGEWVEEYLDAHDGERVTVAKLRWLLGKATAELGEVRLTELSPEQVCAWRLTVPEGHRFEATQALRQVLNRAVAWKLIDENPAKRGVPNPGRRCREQRPFDSRAQIRSVAERLGSSFGPMVVFAAATGLRPSELFALEQGDVDRASAVVHVRRAYANGRVKDTKTRLRDARVRCRRSRSRRSTSFGRGRRARCCFRTHAAATSTSATSTAGTGNRSRKESGSSRCATSTTYATFALRAGVRPLTVHGHEHRDDQPPLRPSRSRQLPARRLAPRRARARTGRGRWPDAAAQARKAAQRHAFQASREAFAAGGGRSVDVEV